MSNLTPQQTYKTVSLMDENRKTLRQLQAENEKLGQQVVDLGVLVLQTGKDAYEKGRRDMNNELAGQEPIRAQVQQLMKFYSVDNLQDLAQQQAIHVEKLQAKLPPFKMQWEPSNPRRG
jgi:hypothetical protein